ncbi:hypothetical protein ACSW0U_003808 [Vibrio fluvialis]|uniref:hypothetical protein n=1 Tax=Vibrio fluvialis TaxID=676 RepID=UPI00130362ED|nr:hypothetical protein [Vibrio fluvialis]
MNTYNLKNIIIVMYLFVPALFYGIPYLYTLSFGGIDLNFFGTQYIESLSLLKILLGHLLIGILVCFFLLKGEYKLQINNGRSILNDMLMLGLFCITFFIPIGLVSMISYPWFLFIFIIRRHYLFSICVLLILSFYLLIYQGVRYPLIQITILMLIPILSRLSIVKLLLLAMISIFLMAFILQPLRSGLIPFVETSEELSYLFQHLQPIYLGANTYLNYNLDASRMLAESVPFLKSIFGYDSVIDLISKEGLNTDAYNNGTRYGSNSSMYFSTFGYVILISFFIFFGLVIRLFKSKKLDSMVLIYLTVYGVYFVRRSFGSYFIDLFVVVFIFLVYLFLVSFFSPNIKEKNT